MYCVYKNFRVCCTEFESRNEQRHLCTNVPINLRDNVGNKKMCLPTLEKIFNADNVGYGTLCF